MGYVEWHLLVTRLPPPIYPHNSLGLVSPHPFILNVHNVAPWNKNGEGEKLGKVFFFQVEPTLIWKIFYSQIGSWNPKVKWNIKNVLSCHHLEKKIQAMKATPWLVKDLQQLFFDEFPPPLDQLKTKETRYSNSWNRKKESWMFPKIVVPPNHPF